MKMPVKHQSSAKVVEFHGNKWVTAYLKWESVIKTTIYRERKSNTFNSDGFFSKAAWFAINRTWTKQNRTFYI